MKSFTVGAVAYVATAVWAMAATTSCRVEQQQTIGGEARAEIVVRYPSAEMCFTDPRIVEVEQLLACLELTTAQKWTVDASGEIIDVLSDGLDGQ